MLHFYWTDSELIFSLSCLSRMVRHAETHPRTWSFSRRKTDWKRVGQTDRAIRPKKVGWWTLFQIEKGDASIPPFDRNSQQQQHDRGLRINEQIRISPVRLIGANGEQLGVVPTSQAMEMAREAQLDLVEVAANERPPVCKILDYGKFRYQQSHKKAKTKVHHQKLKEIRVRPKTGEHDVDTKINQARKFLEHNDKVLVNVLFRGRELQHIEEGRRIIDSILEKLAEVSKVEKAPSMEGKRMTAMLAPKAAKS